MQKIFEEYGGVIIATIAIAALIGLVAVLTSEGGVLANAFTDIVEGFGGRLEEAIGTVPPTT